MDKTGGAAFPVHGMMNRSGQQIEFVSDCGMTLRDYFAAKALQGMLADPNDVGTADDADIYADSAYELADAMLRRRMK